LKKLAAAALLAVLALAAQARAALAPSSASPAPRDPGAAWAGGEADGWDLLATRQGPGADGAVLYSYEASGPGGKTRRGTLEVTSGPRHVKAALLGPTGALLRAYDGTFSEDGRVVTGDVWEITADGTRGPRLAFWATVESSARGTAPPPPLELNRASVLELERAGLSGRSARMVVLARLLQPFRAAAEAAAAPELSAAEKKLLEAGVVR
jgi:hypothetical protein